MSQGLQAKSIKPLEIQLLWKQDCRLQVRPLPKSIWIQSQATQTELGEKALYKQGWIKWSEVIRAFT
jgi:hypothetical protein